MIPEGARKEELKISNGLRADIRVQGVVISFQAAAANRLIPSSDSTDMGLKEICGRQT